MSEDPDYDAMIRSALLQISLECKAGQSVVALAEWLLQLAQDRDRLRGGKVIPLHPHR